MINEIRNTKRVNHDNWTTKRNKHILENTDKDQLSNNINKNKSRKEILIDAIENKSNNDHGIKQF